MTLMIVIVYLYFLYLIPTYSLYFNLSVCEIIIMLLILFSISHLFIVTYHFNLFQYTLLFLLLDIISTLKYINKIYINKKYDFLCVNKLKSWGRVYPTIVVHDTLHVYKVYYRCIPLYYSMLVGSSICIGYVKFVSGVLVV